MVACSICILTVPSYAQSCNCTEYVYLNDPDQMGSVYKFRVEADGSLTQMYSDAPTNTMPYLVGGAATTPTSPHGVGVDEFGNVYVGSQRDENGGIYKYNCYGDFEEITIPAENIAANGPGFPDWTAACNALGGPSNGPAGQQTNIHIVGDKLYANNWLRSCYPVTPIIFEYDLCTGLVAREINICQATTGSSGFGPDLAWGFDINPVTRTLYINAGQNGIAVGSLDAACIDLTIANNFAGGPNEDQFSRGLAYDDLGNVYVRGPSMIAKYAPDGTFINSITLPLNMGGNAGWGIVIADNGYIYTSSDGMECISIYNSTDLSYVGPGFVVPNSGTGTSKAIAYSKECCPATPTTVIDVEVCQSTLPTDTYIVSDMINCDGAFCFSSDAVPDMNNTGITYDICNNTFTIDNFQACGVYTLNSDGNGANNPCGAFDMIINISASNPEPITITGTQPACPTNDPPAITSNMVTGTPTYQWQQSATSCLAGFTDITGATTNTYDPPALTQETYYRLVANYGDPNCTTCEEISNCVTLTPANCCPDPNCFNLSVVRN